MIIDLNCSYMIVQRKIAADDLIAGHFADGACDPVNVEGTVRQAVMDNITSAAVDLFDAAQKQVFRETVWSIPITAVFALIVELSVLNHRRLYIYSSLLLHHSSTDGEFVIRYLHLLQSPPSLYYY